MKGVAPIAKTPVQSFLDQAAAFGIFPGCVLAHGRPAAGGMEVACAGWEGLTRSRRETSPKTVYDLASLTKIFATTAMGMISVERGMLSLDSPLASLGLSPPKDHSKLTVLDLMAHRSGLPAWRPFHVDPDLADKDLLVAAIFKERPLYEIGRRTLYSDLNFILLGILLEKLWGSDLPSLFGDLVAGPLGLAATGYDGLRLASAPTEDGPRIGGPLDYPGAPVMGPVPDGRVHDDNAALLGGPAGHAGLFGSAPDLWRIVAAFAQAYNGQMPSGAGKALWSQETIKAFLAVRPTCEDNGRAAGFDIGTGLLAGWVGHTGYTGGSVWWDPPRDRAFVLLSNRVHPTARGQGMADFRSRLSKLLMTEGRGFDQSRGGRASRRKK